MAELASLPLFHRIAGQKVLVLGEGDAAEPKRRLVTRAGGIVIDDQAQAVDEGVRIAFVAYEDPKACEVAAINLRCAGMLVNVVDRPELCDFTTPSILERDPLLIAIGTGGASAGLAKHVRLRLERFLPATLGKLADALHAVRPKLRERFPGSAERRRALDEALREGGALDAIDPASHERVSGWVEGSQTANAAEWHEVDLASDDPDDLTIRQSRLLGEADALCLHGDIAPAILARARADALRLTCDKAVCPLADPRDPTGGMPVCAGANRTGGVTVILRRETER
ncbi:bifunctional precorrin-2 dehydrogenase/sirohydrochlorin ferrochelatase [Erythrobacter sp. JK5]|uniref:precorrin-2 dehydrogenase/sirohydrochlorin ferrochelatase family protein n=1 Tax=Erythrobacter sp. JK5 TaxID=2829500 RepID=UPI001BA824DB|nr:bifunctional precorrin-2 dehydrogenase/sirohydrochlorin ferrochelatase [Erythrobacter sp. JK5]QUL36500.1 siroheme synthase [Erythrobacter sp. JK5]